MTFEEMFGDTKKIIYEETLFGLKEIKADLKDFFRLYPKGYLLLYNAKGWKDDEIRETIYGGTSAKDLFKKFDWVISYKRNGRLVAQTFMYVYDKK